MDKPFVAQKSPYKVNVEKGKTYFWCSCGLSAKQPFCDSSHKKEGKFSPMEYTAKSNKIIFFCGCKITNHPPFCDNSHTKL
tara:strand:- start:327 stop:569 length:243 start_codon:yes stop_codon:yes gene_type:complete